MLPDHGREIGWEEYSDLDKLALHCRKASETVAKWPTWKRGILGDSLKAQWNVSRFNRRGAETGRTKSYGYMTQAQGVLFDDLRKWDQVNNPELNKPLPDSIKILRKKP